MRTALLIFAYLTFAFTCAYFRPPAPPPAYRANIPSADYAEIFQFVDSWNQDSVAFTLAVFNYYTWYDVK